MLIINYNSDRVISVLSSIKLKDINNFNYLYSTLTNNFLDYLFRS